MILVLESNADQGRKGKQLKFEDDCSHKQQLGL